MPEVESRSQVVHVSSFAYEFNRQKPAMLQINAPLETVAEIAATLVGTGALVLDEIENALLRGAARLAAREEAQP